MRHNRSITGLTIALLLPASVAFAAELPRPTIQPLVRAVDLRIGQTEKVQLCNGRTVSVTLLDLAEERDSIRNAVRRAVVKVNVDARTATLVSSTYNLPVTLGDVLVDCPVTKGYIENSSKSNAWGLLKDARIRLWPADSPLIRADTFRYPVIQKWFATDTQMANVPCYVNACDTPDQKSIYYHYGLDFGGAEAMVQVVAATDGLVVSAAGHTLDGYEDTPVSPRYDVVYVLDDRGWFYRYSHLSMIATPIIPGQRVKIGQRIGLIGKEGGSGGWSHLHFDIHSRQPSGLWGIQNGYAFIRQAYQSQYAPDIIAVARPHNLVSTGEQVELDASKSWSRTGKISTYQWTLCDGTTAKGPRVNRVYDKPGQYNEIVKVTDSAGSFAYDFAVVVVIDKDHPDQLPPAIHAAYYPTFGLQAGDTVTFKVRSFRTQHGQEVWDFGDTTPPVVVRSDGNASQHNPDGYAITEHRYENPGDYIVTAQRSNEFGHIAVTHLHVSIAKTDNAR